MLSRPVVLLPADAAVCSAHLEMLRPVASGAVRVLTALSIGLSARGLGDAAQRAGAMRDEVPGVTIGGVATAIQPATPMQ